MNLKQLEDEIVAARLAIIHEYFLKGIFPIKDLLLSINCVQVDCEAIERCKCGHGGNTMVRHFQIPQLISYYGS
ncbi:MAG: hypothetical protein ACI4OP_00670 [Candidatus Coprovivens sp.]